MDSDSGDSSDTSKLEINESEDSQIESRQRDPRLKKSTSRERKRIWAFGSRKNGVVEDKPSEQESKFIFGFGGLSTDYTIPKQSTSKPVREGWFTENEMNSLAKEQEDFILEHKINLGQLSETSSKKKKKSKLHESQSDCTSSSSRKSKRESVFGKKDLFHAQKPKPFWAEGEKSGEDKQAKKKAKFPFGRKSDSGNMWNFPGGGVKACNVRKDHENNGNGNVRVSGNTEMHRAKKTEGFVFGGRYNNISDNTKDGFLFGKKLIRPGTDTLSTNIDDSMGFQQEVSRLRVELLKKNSIIFELTNKLSDTELELTITKKKLSNMMEQQTNTKKKPVSVKQRLGKRKANEELVDKPKELQDRLGVVFPKEENQRDEDTEQSLPEDLILTELTDFGPIPAKNA